MMVTMTLLKIWTADNEPALVNLDKTGQLIPLITAMMPQLDQAQDMRAELSNQWMADHEILQMAELPLRVPISASQTN